MRCIAFHCIALQCIEVQVFLQCCCLWYVESVLCHLLTCSVQPLHLLSATCSVQPSLVQGFGLSIQSTKLSCASSFPFLDEFVNFLMCAVDKVGSHALEKRTWALFPAISAKMLSSLKFCLLPKQNNPCTTLSVCCYMSQTFLMSTCDGFKDYFCTQHKYYTWNYHCQYFPPARPEVQILCVVKYKLFIGAYCNAQPQS